MKKSNSTKKQQGNTLFSYFSKVKEPKEPVSMSSIIAKTTPKSNVSNSRHSSTTSSYKASISNSISSTTIDLTDDDDDLVILPPRDSPVDLTSSQSSLFNTVDLTSSQTSLFSSSSQSSGQLRNTSKFNNKGWSAKEAALGPERSSQDIIYSQEHKTVQRFEKIRLQQPRITPKANYEWLGPNDVKPFSSKMPLKNESSNSASRPQVIEEYKRYSRQETPMEIDQPRITPKPKYAWLGPSELDRTSPKMPSRSESFNNTSRPQAFEDYKRSNTQEIRSKRSWESASQEKFEWPSAVKKEKKTNVMREGAFWTKSRGTRLRKEDNVTMGTLANRAQMNASLDTEYTPELSSEQQRILSMVINQKESLFFTGSAGTGKSVLLRAIISRLRSEYGSQAAVTASTGIAACNIGGCTLHSFAGIGMGKDSVDQLVYKILENNNSRGRWQDTKVLIIDEISMVDGELFDKLDQIGRKVRRVNQPFGGIQLIVTGDFFQLPPVKPNGQAKFAFEAKSWKEAITTTVMLTKVFRQKDETFVKILNEMRLGILSQEAIRTFKSLSREPEGDGSIQPTELYPLRNEVDESNRRKLEQLRGNVFEFAAVDKGDSRKLEQCLAPKVIKLKMHAQVMLLKNIDSDLVNGSIGVVVGFAGHGDYRSTEKCDKLRTPQHKKESLLSGGLFGGEKEKFNKSTPWPIVRFANDREMLFEHESWSIEFPGGRDPATRYQVPLMLAWAISIHKSQGQTLDRVKVDLGKVFEKGQAYVALSRATSLDTLQILNFNASKVMAHPTVTRFYKTLQTV